MAKKFVRGITEVKDITKQPLSTTNVNDLVSDGKDIYVHRKTPTGEEYFNLTSGNGGGTATPTPAPANIDTPANGGLTSWKEGDSTKVQLSEEFLKNNAQYLEASGGIKATSRQDKYGKSYTFTLDDDTKAKLAKVDELSAGGGTVTPTPTKTELTNADGYLQLTPSTSGYDIGLSTQAKTSLSKVKDIKPHPIIECTNATLLVKKDYTTTGVGEHYVSGYNISLANDIVNKIKKVREEDDGFVKVYTKYGEVAVTLSDTVKEKLNKVDELGQQTIKDITNTDGNLAIGIENYNATINASDTMKAKLDKVDTLETSVGTLTTKVKALEAGGSAGGSTGGNVDLSDYVTTIVAQSSAIEVTEGKTQEGTKSYTLNLSQGVLDNCKPLQPNDDYVEVLHRPSTDLIGLKQEVKTKIDKVPTLETNVTTLETNVTTLTEKVTALENAGSGSEPTEVKQPLFKTYSQDGVRFTMVGVPYGDSNYLGTITIDTAPISNSDGVQLARTNEFAKWLSSMSFPSSGPYRSGDILLLNSNGKIAVRTDPAITIGKIQAQFTVVVSAM